MTRSSLSGGDGLTVHLFSHQFFILISVVIIITSLSNFEGRNVDSAISQIGFDGTFDPKLHVRVCVWRAMQEMHAHNHRIHQSMRPGEVTDFIGTDISDHRIGVIAQQTGSFLLPMDQIRTLIFTQQLRESPTEHVQG